LFRLNIIAGYVEYNYMKRRLKEIAASKGNEAVQAPQTGEATKTHPNTFSNGKDVAMLVREWALLLEEEFNKVENYSKSKVSELQAAFSLLSRRCAGASAADVTGLLDEVDSLGAFVVDFEK
jgi:hypothetical protein